MAIPVISIDQMRAWEKATWESGKTELEVICRVGEVVGARAMRMTRPGDRVLVLAGKGHNGDDARSIQPSLPGRKIVILNLLDPAQMLQELLQALKERPSLIVDGLFGIGLNRPLSAEWIQIIEAVNLNHIPVLSIDVPSGLDADTGGTWGASIRAQVTLTLGAPKQGLLSADAWEYVGRLEVASDIGLAPFPLRGELLWSLPEDFASCLPPRSAAAHKGNFGHLAIVAGSVGYHGAAVLAARGAQRAQPGLITLITPQSVYVPVACQLQSVMVQPWIPEVRIPERATAIVFGPGLAASSLPNELKVEMSRLWMESPLPVICDASGLGWLSPGPVSNGALRVMTPHPGEAAHLLNSTSAKVQTRRQESLRELSARFGDCWVVLKGHQTLLGRKEGVIYVHPSGNPAMAQGGSGDVLVGFLAGLLAQPRLASDPLTALRYGVWHHGAAADRLEESQENWMVEDLPGELGRTGPLGSVRQG